MIASDYSPSMPGVPNVSRIGQRQFRPPTAPNVNPIPAQPGGVGGIASSAATPPAPAPAGPPVPGTSSYASVTPINPNNDLRNQTIAPGGTPDRLAFAKEHYDQFASDLAPQIEAQRRSILSNNAAMGRIGSGMLNTSFGDLTSEINRQNANERSKLFTGAGEAAIGDQANNRAELRGERGYQNALEDTAYTRDRQQRLDQEDLLNSSFARAMQRGQFGYSGNPAGYVGGVAGQVQGQANDSTQGFLDALGARGAGSVGTPRPPQTFGQLPPVSQIPSTNPVYRPQAAPLPRL